MNIDPYRREATPVTDALGRDHERLASLEASAFAAREREDFASAGELFDQFARDLERHIVFEEELLFPVFEREMGLGPGAGPTAVMRDEHAQIRSLLADITGGMRDPAAEVEEHRRALQWVLLEHNRKEEEVLYPMTDQALGEDRAEGLVQGFTSASGRTLP